MKKLAQSIIVLSFVLLTFLTPLSVTISKNKINRYIPILNIKHVFAQNAPTDVNTEETETKVVEVSTPDNSKDHNKGGYLNCGVWDFACKGINFLQMIFIGAGNFLVGISAFVMNIFLSHSLQSASYKDAGFITQGWEILRDMTNLLFIFALIYTAFNLVLGTGGSDTKKRLIKVILIALTVNFSLFVTLAIIDVSNIFAHVFYNKIEQKEVVLKTLSSTGEGEQVIDEEQTIGGTSPSLAIAAKINPQLLFTSPSTVEATRSQRIVLILVGGIINGALIYTFLSVTFLFLGRTIGLWLAAVLSPLAFASITVPGLENMDYIGFKKWFSSLLQMAFMAPVFLFFLYLTVQFMKVDINYNVSSSGSFVTGILAIVIPMLAVVVLILLSKKIAEKMSGDFAGVISKFVAKGAMAVGGVALGAVTGGAAMLGRKAIGGAAASAMKNDRIKDWAAGKGKFGKYAMSGMDRLQSSTFDFRNTAAAKTVGIKSGLFQSDKGYAGLRDEKEAKSLADTKKFDTWLSTKDDTHMKDASGNKSYGVKSYDRHTKESAAAYNEGRPEAEHIKAGSIDHSGSYEVLRKKDIENRILENESNKNKKVEDLSDQQKEIKDLKDRGAHLAGSPLADDYETALNKRDEIKNEISELSATIKGYKTDLTDKDGSNVTRGRITGFEDKKRRTETYLEKRSKQGEYGSLRNGAALGASAAIIGGALGSAILPGLGTAIGAKGGAILAAAVTALPVVAVGGAGAIINEKWNQDSTTKSKKTRREKVFGIPLTHRDDNLDTDRNLAGAQYRKEKEDK